MAEATEIQQVRRRIGDSRKSDTVQFVGNGADTLYTLPNQNIFDVEVHINSTLVAKEAYTVNQEAGKVVFLDAPDEADVISITFAYAGYTDDQMSEMIDTYGVEGSVIETLNGLLADSARFYDYSQGQTTDKRSQIFDHLKDLLATAKSELVASTTPDMSIGNRYQSYSRKGYALDLSRDDGSGVPVNGYSSNNV